MKVAFVLTVEIPETHDPMNVDYWAHVFKDVIKTEISYDSILKDCEIIPMEVSKS